MHDPFTTPLAVKLIAGLGGLTGGASFMVFYKPKNVWDAAVRSGLSVIAAIVFSPLLIDNMDMHPTNEIVLAVSVALGFCAWSVLSLIARFLINIQDEKVNIKLPSILERK